MQGLEWLSCQWVLLFSFSYCCFILHDTDALRRIYYSCASWSTANLPATPPCLSATLPFRRLPGSVLHGSICSAISLQCQPRPVGRLTWAQARGGEGKPQFRTQSRKSERFRDIRNTDDDVSRAAAREAPGDIQFPDTVFMLRPSASLNENRERCCDISEPRSDCRLGSWDAGRIKSVKLVCRVSRSPAMLPSFKGSWQDRRHLPSCWDPFLRPTAEGSAAALTPPGS